MMYEPQILANLGDRIFLSDHEAKEFFLKMLDINRERIHFRDAGFTRELYNLRGSEFDWHRDGDVHNPSLFIVVWSNKSPTEFYGIPPERFKPGDVILVNNALIKHRSPQIYEPGRQFARVWNVDPAHTIAAVAEYLNGAQQ